MAQLSIFEKQRHYSTKDFTCSVGKYDYIYITFRNHSWKRFTSSDKIGVEIKNNVLVFGDPEEHPEARSYKLRRTRGDIETTEHTRYLQISGKSWPAFLEAARNMSGSFNFDEALNIKVTDPEQIEKLKKAMAKAKPMKLEPLEEPIPKGFIELHGAAAGERVLVILSDIEQVCEVLPGSRIAPSFLRPEEAKAKTVIFGKRPECFLETYEEVIEKMRKAMTPQVEMNKNGLTFWT